MTTEILTPDGPEPLADPEAADAAAVSITARYRKRYKDLMAGVEDWTRRHGNGIPDEDVASRTTKLLAQIVTFTGRMGEERAALAQPLKEAIGFIDDRFKPFLEVFSAPETKLREALKQYGIAKDKQERERRRAIAEKRRQRAVTAATEARESNDHLDILQMLRADMSAAQAEQRAAAPTSQLSKVSGDHGTSAAVTMRWTWKVADFEQIPREWLMIDRAKIEAEKTRLTSAGVCTMKIPGIEVFQDASLTVRGT